MVRDILSKLDDELHQEITTERQVVYILVETRKLIEKNRLANKFEALGLHCNWAVHTELSKGQARTLLAGLNKHYSEILSKGQAKEAIQKIGERLGLEPFRVEFRQFLELLGLYKEFCDGDSWLAFLYHYSQVIRDCLLVSRAAALPSWHFNELVLVGGPEDLGDEGKICIQWELLLKGRSVGLWLAHI
jgi:hypothetical protein